MPDLTEAQFLKDVAEHQLEILRDDGLYRHLRFAKPGTTTMLFELVTWPGYLCFCGDMGEFVFTRLPDMFNFFRSSRQDRIAGETLYINTGYWGEKCVAVDAADGIREYSPDMFREAIKDWLAEQLEDMEGEDDFEEFKAAITEAVEDDLLSCADDSEYVAREAVSGFEFEFAGNTYSIADFWEQTLTVKTFRFIWCCYAIVWGIMQYDKLKEA